MTSAILARSTARVVVVGASLAGHRAAAALRSLGYDGSLTVVGAEQHPPYDRFPLSKDYLAGRMSRRRLDLPDLARGSLPDVEWRFGAEATGLDLSTNTVRLDDGGSIGFDAVVVATGAEASGREQAEGVGGVFTLRTVEDAQALRRALRRRFARVVVVGGGLIGAEVAATAAERGHAVTLVDPGKLPTARSVGADVARLLLALHRAAGIEVVTGRMQALERLEGRVTGVVLDKGLRLPADVVLLATGTRPNVEWLRGSGLRTDRGLLCDATLHAAGSDIVVGAGDVVRAPHPLADEPVRVEHWHSTRHQADLAAANLLKGRAGAQPLVELPTFGTTIHGARVRLVGFAQGADTSRVLRGSVADGEALIGLARRGTVIGVVSLNAHHLLPGLTPLLRPGLSLGNLGAVVRDCSSAAAATP
jgi:3-phenylpropionate/trans-cinnamate dioxygenase ferredoxin reductase subunit